MYHIRHHGDEVTGSIIGAILVAANNLIHAIDISWAEILNTIILAAIGATAGYIATGILKWIKGRAIKLMGRKPK